jgi:DNA (cytosine-5)-methyltransferase 1
MTLTIGSLFAGIGGIELGLERAGFGPTLWQVEKDPKCRAVLATHWPEAVRYDDVCAIDGAAIARVDLICGGFPCQDISSAGKRAGFAGARSGLWHHFARIVADCRPRWVVVENVRSGARKYVDAVRGELGRLGYASLPIPISAADCGAPHERARLFIVGALTDSDHRQQPNESRKGERQRGAGAGPQSAELATYPDGTREPQPQRHEPEEWQRPGRCHDGHWSSEPDVARMVSRLPGRVDRERMLGNCVVPQCAEVVGHVIRRLIGGAA